MHEIFLKKISKKILQKDRNFAKNTRELVVGLLNLSHVRDSTSLKTGYIVVLNFVSQEAQFTFFLLQNKLIAVAAFKDNILTLKYRSIF